MARSLDKEREAASPVSGSIYPHMFISQQNKALTKKNHTFESRTNIVLLLAKTGFKPFT